MIKSQKINFYFDKVLVSELQAPILDLPIPIRNCLPDWYKKADRFIGGNFDINSAGPNSDLASCVPFLDSLTFGYAITTFSDILVINHGTTSEFKWLGNLTPLSMRADNVAPTVPRPAGYHSTHFAWNNVVGFKLPKGYSALVSHPLNRFDLPFTTLSGIIDADSPIGGGNIPFFIRNDFEGLIPKGTPIAQVIPFKRDNWKREQPNPEYSESARVFNGKARSILQGFYKKTAWNKKSFE
jgi:hypothetical protein